MAGQHSLPENLENDFQHPATEQQCVLSMCRHSKSAVDHRTVTAEPCTAEASHSRRAAALLWRLTGRHTSRPRPDRVSRSRKADHRQNLIPLCIRPFRLFLPSEQLRGARIVLLKATHLPFVLAIWAYEQLADARNRNSNVLSFSGPQTPLLKKTPRLAVNTPRLLMADPQAAPNSLGRLQHANRPHTSVGLMEPDLQLKTLVLKLTTQVDELKVIVSQLQEQREASMAA